MKIVLINPPKFHQVWAGVPDLFNRPEIYLFPPLGIMYLSAYLKKYTRHRVWLLDCVADRLTPLKAAQRVKTLNPQAVGITALTHNLVDIKQLIAELKKLLPEVHIILGGPHTYVFPQKAIKLPGVDCVVKGDGEETLAAWLNALEENGTRSRVAGVIYRAKGEGEILENPEAKPLEDLDCLPFPDRRALLDKKYFTPAMRAASATTLISSRGCPFKCIFCSTHKNFRERSPQNIVDEIEDCVVNLGIKELYFIDDTFNTTPRRVIEISQEILKRGLKFAWGFKGSPAGVTPEMLKTAKEAGCTKIHYGVETANPEGLSYLGKKATPEQSLTAFSLSKKAGIRAIAYLMLGLPFEKSREEILKLKALVRKLSPDYVVYSLFSPYPDAPVFQEGVKKGLYPPDCWDKFMENPLPDYRLPTCWEEHLSKSELVGVLKELHRDFYFNPRVIVKTLFSAASWVELKRLLQGGLSLLRFLSLNPRDKRI